MDGSPQTTTRDYNPALDPVFQRVLTKLFGEEGNRFTADPADPGGATKLGVSLRYLVALGQLDRHWITEFDADRDGKLTAKDIAAITPAEAGDLYGEEFWVKPGVYLLPAPFNAAVFDEAVNSGPTVAVMLLQEALRDSSIVVKQDGLLGPHTLVEVEGEIASGRSELLLTHYRTRVETRYRGLVQQNPQLAKYLEGWITRARNLGAGFA